MYIIYNIIFNYCSICSKGSCASTNVKTRNRFRIRALKHRNDQWSDKNQKVQTELVRSHHGPDLNTFNFGSNDCKVVVRAKMETFPLKSACRPTLKIEIVPALKDPTHSNHAGEKIYVYTF